MTEPRRYGVQPDSADVLTPSQTVGPFFAYALTPHEYPTIREVFTHDLATADAAGERIRIEGYILDGDGEPIVDAIVELWQADGAGRFAGRDGAGSNAGFTGFGRTDVDTNGFFAFTTVKPGAVAGPDGRPQAPHVNVSIFARGVLKRLFTRVYFSDESANDADPILALVPPERRGTLIAARHERGGEPPAYRATIRLQGENETVFFEA